MLRLITSLNIRLFEEYGRRMVRGFEENAGEDIELVVVFEGPIPPEAEKFSKRCRFVPFVHPQHAQFLKFFGHLYEANGMRMVPLPNSKDFTIQKQFIFDAVRYSFKVFAVDAGRKAEGKVYRYAWIDADVNCLKPFTASSLDPYLPDNGELMSYLRRDLYPYSECGFLGFNPAHPDTEDFLARMRQIYLSGEVFSLEQWHDSWIWDVVRREFENKGAKFRNISGEASTTEHPFINCGLGEFFDHLKGKQRKKLGHSLDSDYIKRKKSI